MAHLPLHPAAAMALNPSRLPNAPMCNCAERRAALMSAARAALARDGAQASAQLAFVAASAALDAKALASRAVSAARTRLAR